MGIADLHQAHLLGELGRCEGIGGGPHMVVGHPAAGQPQNAQDQGRRPRPIALRLPFADFCDEEGDQVTDHPEGHQMEEADHCVHQVQGGPQEDGRRREEPEAQEPRQPLFAMGQPQHRRKAGRPEGDIEEPRGEYSQHGPDDHKPNRHSFPSQTKSPFFSFDHLSVPVGFMPVCFPKRCRSIGPGSPGPPGPPRFFQLVRARAPPGPSRTAR